MNLLVRGMQTKDEEGKTKHMKKMRRRKNFAGIVLALMMVLGILDFCNGETVRAEETAGTGTITIQNAVPGQTYKIYQILDLESYSGNGQDGKYAYRLRGNHWDEFIQRSDIKDHYLTINDAYVSGIKDADGEQLAKKAEEFVRTKGIQEDGKLTVSKDSASEQRATVTFSDIPLGYYFVESSLGTVCSLNTNAPVVTIEEKNGVPMIMKRVQEDSKTGADAWGSVNTADIGQTVNFQTTITVQKGAKNYVLHDKMSDGLTFQSVFLVQLDGMDADLVSDYEVKRADKTDLGDSCTFHVEFVDEFCEGFEADQKLVVSYTAVLNENAVIAGEGNPNETWLIYGDNAETSHDFTKTKTYKIPVFKYWKKENAEEGLADAVFVLSSDPEGTNRIKLVSKGRDGSADTDIYRVAKKTEDSEVVKIEEIKTSASGKFVIEGLDADTYYLKETDAPKGYNKLSKAVKIQIDEDGVITVDDSETAVELVKIKNQAGFILPATGDIGTTIFYLAGSVLVFGSGIILIRKKRMK